MRTDVRVEHCAVEFRTVPFRRPLTLSSGPIHSLTEARASITVVNRVGVEAIGCGSVLLSYPWCGASDDAAMRAGVLGLARKLEDDPVFADVFEHAMRLDSSLADPTFLGALARRVCLAPLDAALHDAWGRAAGLDTYAMYGPEHIGQDLSAEFGAKFRDRFVADYLVPTAARPATLRVSHVVGIDDDGDSLSARMRSEPVAWLKVKLDLRDPAADVVRLVDLFEAAETAREGRTRAVTPLRMSLDPNESCGSPTELSEFLHRLATRCGHVRRAVGYVEQPFPRSLDLPAAELRALTREPPVLLDEGLADVVRLPDLIAGGWSGVALKTARTQTQCLLAAAYAAHHGLSVAIQDLTNVGLGVVQSARLAAAAPLTWRVLESNSRDLAPVANIEEELLCPSVFQVRDGRISLADAAGHGLY